MDDLYLGQIVLFAGPFAPRNTLFCNGQLLAITSYTQLFSILGTTYGGDGRTTFKLPDLRGRVPVNSGNNSTGPGLTSRRLGQFSGEENHTLITPEMPTHTHLASPTASGASISGSASAKMYSNATAGTDAASGNFIANNGGGDGFANTTDNTTLNDNAITVDTSGLTVDINGLNVTNLPTGGSRSHNNMQPWLAVNYIICTVGEYPLRS